MSYKLTSDIEPSNKVDVNILDEQMTIVVNRITAGFNKLGSHNPTFRSLTETLFQSFLTTHKSIRLLLKEVKSDLNYASDAMSLVREQIEKVFVISLILDDPGKWIPIYFKDDWRRFYKYQFLVLEEERNSLPRFQVDKDKREKILENLKNNADLSDLEKELIEHKFTQPGVSRPAHLASVEIPQFPAPREAAEKVIDSTTKEFLLRWHKEYEYVCGYSHVGLEKLQVISMQRVRNRLSEEAKKKFVNNEIVQPAITMSYLATASACTEAWKYLKQYDLDLSKSDEFLDAILTFWDKLRKQSLWGIVFWEIHARIVLPPIIGQP